MYMPGHVKEIRRGYFRLAEVGPVRQRADVDKSS